MRNEEFLEDDVPLLKPILEKVKLCLDKLYIDDADLFTRNKKRGLGERCLVFRFAHYLQLIFPEYFVDCDFNSSSDGYGGLSSGKPIPNLDGTHTGRFADIIVHKRGTGNGLFTDFICFEVKKWNTSRPEADAKDELVLRGLTQVYGYKYGFHLILGKNRWETKVIIYEREKPPSAKLLV